jgi:hypothetical protein
VNVWTEPAVAAFSRFPNEVTYFLYGSRGAMIALNLKFVPEPVGVQRSIAGPCEVLYMMAPWGR